MTGEQTGLVAAPPSVWAGNLVQVVGPRITFGRLTDSYPQ